MKELKENRQPTDSDEDLARYVQQGKHDLQILADLVEFFGPRFMQEMRVRWTDETLRRWEEAEKGLKELADD